MLGVLVILGARRLRNNGTIVFQFIVFKNILKIFFYFLKIIF
jgi:hypothetical protein